MDGVPVWWAESDRECEGALVFRAGRSDETLARSGVSHLVEHLALPIGEHPEVEFNGTVDGTNTLFWATGDQHVVVEFLRDTCEALTALPVARLERELGILRTEATDWRPGIAGYAASLRFGAAGHGLVGFDELGLHGLSAGTVLDWARTHFTRGNVAVYLTREPPPDFSLPLPDGPRVAPAEPRQIEYLEFPSALAAAMPDTVAISCLFARTPAATLGLGILESRLRDRLRHRAGLSYAVGIWYEPLTSDLAHVALWADAMPENVQSVRNTMLAVLDDLAEHGPRPEELEHELEELEDGLRDPDGVLSRLFQAASRELIGMPVESDAELVARRRAVTSDEAAAAVARAAASALVMLPEGATLPGGRFKAYPLRSPTRAAGRRHRPRSLRRRFRPDETIFADRRAITYEGHGHVNTVRFAEAVALMRWDDGSRTIWGRDGFHVYVDGREWQAGDELVRLLDDSVERSVVIDSSATADDERFVAALEHLEAGKHEDALVAAIAGLEEHPDSPLGLRCLASSYLELQRPAEALAAARQAVDADPSNEWGHRLLAHALWRLDNRDEATDHALAALDLDPGGLDALSTCAWVLSESGKLDDAERVGRRAVELYPDESDAWNALAQSLDAKGEREEGEAALRRAVALGPDSHVVQNNLGWNLMQQRRPAEALHFLQRSLELAPEYETALSNRALALAMTGRGDEASRAMRELREAWYRRAQEALNRAETVDMLSEAASAAWWSGRREEAVDLARRALASERNARTLEELAWKLMNVGRPEEARELARQGTAEYPDSLAMHSLALWIAALMDDPPSADTAFARVHALSSAPTYRAQAEGYRAAASGDWESAKSGFERRLSLEPFHCCAEAWLGLAELETGERAAACQRLERPWVALWDCACAAAQRLERGLVEQPSTDA